MTCATVAHADIGSDSFLGPADLRNQRPYQLLFLNFEPESAVVLNPGEKRVEAQFDIGNDLLLPYSTGPTVHEDTETQRLELNESRGIAPGLEASVSGSLMWRNGGFTDKIAQTYHNFIGFNHPTPDVNVGRKSISSYHSIVQLLGADGTPIINAGPAFGIGDVSFFLKQSLCREENRAVSARIGIKLPTGNAAQLLGSGGTDYGADLDSSFQIGRRTALYSNLSYVLQHADAHFAGRAADHVAHSMLAIEYRKTATASWILQNDIAGAGIKTGNKFADGLNSGIAIAYKTRCTNNSVWTYAATENGDILQYKFHGIANVGPDITWSVGWSQLSR